jgi:hypothetical protein
MSLVIGGMWAVGSSGTTAPVSTTDEHRLIIISHRILKSQRTKFGIPILLDNHKRPDLEKPENKILCTFDLLSLRELLKKNILKIIYGRRRKIGARHLRH